MKSALLLILVLLAAGCVEQQVEYLYVCPDGSTVNQRIDCVITNNTEEVVPVAYPEESEYNASEIEKEIFNLVNEKRAQYDIKSLQWNNKIASIAKNKSKEMSDMDYFNHENPDGIGFSDVLRQNEIFYMAASEDIAMIGSSAKDLAQTVVAGWLESPSHRVPILDRDEIYTDTGVGVFCDKSICYFTIQFVKLETELSVSLKQRYGTFLYIYDPALDFEYDANVMLEINSTANTDAYVVESSDIYDLFMQGYPIYSEREFKHTGVVNTTLRAKKGYGIILFSDPDWVFSDAQVIVKIRYY
ncbi:MAG: CAP domain-containing protein [Candidatus Aenigmarchaeota archaeon]|nr:CAP domain-containing protein [Candidatus Aenigmarchaeota archaeon]